MAFVDHRFWRPYALSVSGGRAPSVSVVMAVHNCQQFVAGALTSLLEQTYSDIEVIVVDDGSSDDSPAEVTRVADSRVSLVRLPEPSGDLAIALNEGVGRSRGDLIARMDADDVCVPTRLAQQTSTMRARPAVGMLGTWVDALDKDGVSWLVSRPPCEDEAIRFILNYRCPFHHPSMMLRRSVLEAAGGYRVGYRYAEDYDLWRRMIDHGRAANLPEVLLKQRYYASSTSGSNRRLQDATSDRIGAEMVGAKLGRQVHESVIGMLREQVGPLRLRRLAAKTLADLYRACAHMPDFGDAGTLKRTAANELVDLAVHGGARPESLALWGAAFPIDPPTVTRKAIDLAKQAVRRRSPA
jgi:Glycosyl transferase family 2